MATKTEYEPCSWMDADGNVGADELDAWVDAEQVKAKGREPAKQDPALIALLDSMGRASDLFRT